VIIVANLYFDVSPQESYGQAFSLWAQNQVGLFPLFPQPERLQHQIRLSRFPQPERLAHHKVRHRLTTPHPHTHQTSQPERLKLIITPPSDGEVLPSKLSQTYGLPGIIGEALCFDVSPQESYGQAFSL